MGNQLLNLLSLFRLTTDIHANCYTVYPFTNGEVKVNLQSAYVNKAVPTFQLSCFTLYAWIMSILRDTLNHRRRNDCIF